MENDRPEENPAGTSILGCLIPVFWMLAGNGILALSALAIASNRTDLLSVADVVYWVTVGCLMAARYADIRYLGGRTAEGKSATMAHWRRYVIILIAVSAVLWIVAHMVPDLGG